MIFSLINVTKRKDDTVSGYWITDHIGTLESAKKLAKETSMLNSKLDITVVDHINSTVPLLSFCSNLKPL